MKTPLEQRIENVEQWELRKGKKELLRHLQGGKPLTRAEALVAKCYDCMCGYEGGESKDCLAYMCPLYDFQPYKEGGARKTKTMSDESRAKIAATKRSRN